MAEKRVALAYAILSLFIAFGPTESVGDTISTLTHLFGLGEVRVIAVSPDLEYVATGGQGGAFLWKIQSATLRKRLDLNWSATALAFSPDSKMLVVASVTSIIAWDTETGVRLREFVGHQGEITRLQFSPDGKSLISASADNSVRVWSLENGAEIHSIRTPGSPIIDVAISPDGTKLVTVDTFLTNCVKIWDITTEAQLRALPKTNWTAQRCVFTPQGQILTGAHDRTATLWNTETAEEIRSFTGVTGPTVIILDLWMPNDSSVAATCNDGSTYLWNLETGALARVVSGDPTIAAIGTANDFLTVTAAIDYNVRIRQLPEGQTLRTFKGHTTSVHSGVAFSPDGKYIVSGGTEASTRLWNRQTGEPIREFVGGGAGTMAAAFSPDGSRVLTTIGLPNPAARLWNTETGELEREFKWAGSWPMGAVFSPDGTKIAARLQGKEVRIFDVDTGALIRNLPDESWGTAVAFAPSAPLVVIASTDFNAELYNYESGQRLHTFFANAGPVSSVAFSPNGDTLLIAWQDGVIHLYNSLTMDLRREFLTPAAFLEAAAYSPDGQYILTGEGWPFFTATLWDAQTAEPLRTFQGHKWAVSAVGFSQDGMSILTGADLVREWSIASVAARVQVERLPNQVRLRWGLGKLQQASAPQGPWETITNAVSPLTMDLIEPMRFYRVQVETN